MAEQITYAPRADGKINVRIGRRVTGVIVPNKFGGGFRYRAKGGIYGDTLPTVEAVKRSLES